MTENESSENSAAETPPEAATLVPALCGYRVTELHFSNVLRVVVVNVTPPEDYVEVTGDNGNGKTSTLKAIEALLRGPKAFPPDIVHRGKREAKMIGTFEAIDELVELIDAEGNEILPAFKINRRVSPRGAMKLELTRPDGTPIPRPQEFLDKLIAAISFDPLEFLRDKKKRVEAMLKITNLEKPLEVIALKRKELFDRRTLVSREVRDKEGALKELPIPKNAPDAAVDTAQLVQLRKNATERLAQRETVDTELVALKLEEERIEGVAKVAALEIGELENMLRLKKDILVKAQTAYGVAVERRVAKYNEILKLDNVEVFQAAVDAIDKDLSDAGELNARFESARQYREKAKELDAKRNEKVEVSDGIGELDADKLQLFEAADYPVEGMRFGEDDLTIDGLPFEQESDAARLRISMEIAAAISPLVRLILLRRANDLDDNALAVVKAFAKEKRFQIWAEKIHASEAPAIILEDGEAVGGTAVSK